MKPKPDRALDAAPQRTTPAPCGQPHCNGCYEVEPGVRIHPPRSGSARQPGE